MTLPARTNNPCSLEYFPTIAWEGLSDPLHIEQLCNFISVQYGFRAAAKQLKSYRARGINTVSTLIPKWSPKAAGNPTDAYIADVERWSGIPKDRLLTDADTLPLLRAMAQQEGGVIYSDSVIQEGIDMANSMKISEVISHPATAKAITGGTIAAFVATELHSRLSIDISNGETIALGLILTILLHRFFPNGLNIE